MMESGRRRCSQWCRQHVVVAFGVAYVKKGTKDGCGHELMMKDCTQQQPSVCSLHICVKEKSGQMRSREEIIKGGGGGDDN